jgi:chemotaxis protein MotB
MAHYMLIRGGLDEQRIEKIEGYADRRLKTPQDPLGAVNRRIEILVRKEKP